jgi:glycosyltransferase involved in cell wall biosynthesis
VKRANANFDEIWTPSAWNLDVFKTSGIRLPGRVMPLGIDPVVFRYMGHAPLPPCRLISTARRGLIASPQGFVFLTMGLPGFRKGWDVIADAAELAFGRRRNVHLVIALTHSPPAWNEKIYKQFAGYKVPIWTLEGSFDEHGIARILSSANAYVSASRGEGFNLPAAEAAACGIPVIVPDNTCHTEIFGPEAFLLKPDGVKTYPEGDWISDWYKGQLFSRFGTPAIRRLAEIMKAVSLDGPVARDRAEKLREKITSRYTWDIAAARAAERLLEVQP